MKHVKEMYQHETNQEEILEKINHLLTVKDEQVFGFIFHYINQEFEIKNLWKVVLEQNKSKSLHYFYTKMIHVEKWLYLYHAVFGNNKSNYYKDSRTKNDFQEWRDLFTIKSKKYKNILDCCSLYKEQILQHLNEREKDLGFITNYIIEWNDLQQWITVKRS